MQEAVFEDTKHLVRSALDGYNVCVFAYGQTGSGKTFTIYGNEANPGLTPRGVKEMFMMIDKDAGKASYSVRLQMLELYQVWTRVCSTSMRCWGVSRDKNLQHDCRMVGAGLR